MKKLVFPAKIEGVIEAPASKSIAQRAIAAAMLARGKSVLRNYTPCNDSEAAILIANNLGAIVNKGQRNLFVDGGFRALSSTINCGESGLGIRMFTPIVALLNDEIILTGERTLKNRPVDLLEKPLNAFGAYCKSTDGLLPINVKGPLKGGITEVDGSISSQILTGLLMALPLAENDSIIYVVNLKSKPYIDITISLLQSFGIEIVNKDYRIFEIKGNQKYNPIEYSIEGDWSGAAFLLIAGALNGEIKVENLNIRSNQADREILNVLRLAGADISMLDDSIIVKRKLLNPFEFDASHCPDLFPPLVALASHCQGVTVIKGVSRLTHKESNRGIVLKTEFEKIGVNIEISNDLMKIYGGSVKGGIIHSNNDHRIAMAGAIAAILAENPIEIENAESINKSYPSFFEDLRSVCQNK